MQGAGLVNNLSSLLLSWVPLNEMVI